MKILSFVSKKNVTGKTLNEVMLGMLYLNNSHSVFDIKFSDNKEFNIVQTECFDMYLFVTPIEMNISN